MSGARILILETSDRVGQVALARGKELVAERRLDQSRRHARDLAPAVRELLAGQGWNARDLDAVFVSRGPGSYTGLRVGIMSAKTLAYATGCALVAVDTMAALAYQAEPTRSLVDVLVDAQQDKVYVQSFERDGAAWQARTALAIRPFGDWLLQRAVEAAVTGPGLRKWGERLPADVPVVESTRWDAQASSVLGLGLKRLDGGERDDVFAVEPLYLRASSAEEQLLARGGER